MKTLDQLRQERDESAQAVRDAMQGETEARDAGTEITEEHEEVFRYLLDVAKLARDAYEKAEERARAIDDVLADADDYQPATFQHQRTAEPFDVARVADAPRTEVRDALIRSVESQERSAPDGAIDAIHDLASRGEGENWSSEYFVRAAMAKEDDTYRSAFMKVVRNQVASLTPDESAAIARAQALDPASAGGYGVPVLIDPTIMVTNGTGFNPVLDVCRIESITTDKWNGVTSPQVVWSMDAEAEEVSDDSVTLAQPVVETKKPQAFVPFSIEIGMDYPNFAREMSRVINDGYTDLVAAQVAVGDGTGNNIEGVKTGATTTVNGTFDDALVDAVYGAVPEKFRVNGSWLGNVATESAIRAFGQANQTSRFTVDWTAEGITRLNGKRFLTMDNYPSGVAVTDEPYVFGDFRHYLFVQRVGMTVDLVPHIFGANQRPTGQRGFYAYARFGGGVLVANAFRKAVVS